MSRWCWSCNAGQIEGAVFSVKSYTTHSRIHLPTWRNYVIASSQRTELEERFPCLVTSSTTHNVETIVFEIRPSCTEVSIYRRELIHGGDRVLWRRGVSKALPEKKVRGHFLRYFHIRGTINKEFRRSKRSSHRLTRRYCRKREILRKTIIIDDLLRRTRLIQ